MADHLMNNSVGKNGTAAYDHLCQAQMSGFILALLEYQLQKILLDAMTNLCRYDLEEEKHRTRGRILI